MSDSAMRSPETILVGEIGRVVRGPLPPATLTRTTKRQDALDRANEVAVLRTEVARLQAALDEVTQERDALYRRLHPNGV